MLNSQEYIKTWSEKLSLPVETITNDFEKLLIEEKSLHPESTTEQLNDRALQRLASSFKKALRSPAVGFEGIIIGTSDTVDTVAKKRKEAIEFYNTNPQKAIEMGITDINGTPLETKKEWNDGRPNTNFGKPLQETSFLKNVYGIAVKSSTKDTPKFFSLLISGENAKKDNIPLFTPLRFRAIDKTEDQNKDKQYTLNASQFSQFDIDQTLKLPTVHSMITQFCSDKIVKMSNLEAYHNQVKEEFNRIVIVEGDVSTLVTEPTANGSRRMVIEDAENIDLEAKGVTCWIPSRVPIDFAEQSKVLVIGRTGQGKKRDSEELGDVSMNTYGIFAIPEYKILPTVTAKEDLNTEIPEAKDW